MHVYEHVLNSVPFRIDDRVRYPRLERVNASYAITSNGDVGLSRLVAGSVINCTDADDHVKVADAGRRYRLLGEHSEDNGEESSEPKEISLHLRLTVSNARVDAKRFGVHGRVRTRQSSDVSVRCHKIGGCVDAFNF